MGVTGEGEGGMVEMMVLARGLGGGGGVGWVDATFKTASKPGRSNWINSLRLLDAVST